MRYKAVPGVVMTSVCDHTYLVTADETIEINDTAVFYWKHLEKGVSEEELVQYASESYGISETESLKEDVRAMLEDLRRRHLVLRYRG